MDLDAAAVFFSELQVQCGFALDAFEAVERALDEYATTDPNTAKAWPSRDAVFRNLHSFLTHAANVSKMLWPALPNQRKHESPEAYQERISKLARYKRGLFLREALGRDDSSPLISRELRDHLDHFDQRLDTWSADEGRRHYLQNYIGDARKRTSIKRGHQMRSFDPERKVFGFRGEEFELAVILPELRDIKLRSAGAAFHASTGFRHARPAV